MRRRVEFIVDCDTGILYGPLDKAIEYLKKIHSEFPNVMLEEKWTGYEDMHMRFLGERDETDEEMNLREREERRKKKEEESAASQRKYQEGQKEILAIAKKLGIRVEMK